MDRQGKAKLKDEFKGLLDKAGAVLLAEYRGMTVQQVTELRRAVREVDGEFKVTKNRVMRLATQEEGSQFQALSSGLKGPLGAVFMYGDVAAATKKVLEFEKSNENFKVQSAVLEGKVLSIADLKALSDLPSKEVLLARIVGTLVAPHRGLVTVLSGVTRNLVQVINAIKETKQA